MVSCGKVECLCKADPLEEQALPPLNFHLSSDLAMDFISSHLPDSLQLESSISLVLTPPPFCLSLASGCLSLPILPVHSAPKVTDMDVHAWWFQQP